MLYLLKESATWFIDIFLGLNFRAILSMFLSGSDPLPASTIEFSTISPNELAILEGIF